MFGFTTWDEFFKWYNKLDLDDTAAEDVVIGNDPNSGGGEVALEKGQSRRKQLKKKFRNKEYDEYNPRSFESLKDAARDKLFAPAFTMGGKFSEYDLNDFEEFYVIKEDDVYKVADCDPDEMAEKDYDTFGTMPSIISRRDKRKFDDTDVDNIKAFVAYKDKINRQFSPNLRYEVRVSKGGKQAELGVLFA